MPHFLMSFLIFVLIVALCLLLIDCPERYQKQIVVLRTIAIKTEVYKSKEVDFCLKKKYSWDTVADSTTGDKPLDK